MQDILTSLLPPESEPGLGVEILRGNVEGRWFSGGSTRSAAFSFSWLEYVGAVLTASLSPTAPIQSIETEGEPIRIGRCLAGPGAFSRREALLSHLRTHTGATAHLPSVAHQEGKRKRSYL